MRKILAAAGVLALAASLPVAATASTPDLGEPLGPPWCGTPEPDVAGDKGNIPYYAIKCTLDEIEAQSNGRITVEQAGTSTLGRPLYAVTVDARDTPAQRRNSDRYWAIEAIETKNPDRAIRMLDRYGEDVKAPVFYQANIHGNETESTDASIQFIKEVATTPYGVDPELDQVLDHAVIVFNVTANPDGRVLGQRGNANKIDMNRDYLTQSQPEIRASVALMRDLHPVLTVDQHGYYNPTEVDGETLPHNPGLEYDLIMPFNEGRVIEQKAALEAAGYPVQIPRHDWCSDGSLPPAGGLCPDGNPPSQDTAQGFDDFGPFYTAVYGNLTGLDGTTPEMCGSNSSPTAGCTPLPDAPAGTPTGREGSLLNAYTNIWSSIGYVMDNHNEMLGAKLESFRRGDAGEERRFCCEEPWGEAHNWTTPYPNAYVIPVGSGQRSEAEAGRLVAYLLFNEIEVSTLQQDVRVGSARYPRGSYVVSMKQPLRGLADTMLSLGLDISDRIERLYAPPAAWSRSALWGAQVEVVPADVAFSPRTSPVRNAPKVKGGITGGKAGVYAIEVDSTSAVRAVNAVLRSGADGRVATAPVSARQQQQAVTLPAGTMLFPTSAKSALVAAGKANGIPVLPLQLNGTPQTTPVTDVPRVAQVMTFNNQNSNSSTGGPLVALRSLGFDAQQVYTDATQPLSDPAQPNPLDGYDVVYVSSGNWPTSATAQERLRAFFADGGGYIGSSNSGNNFIGSAGAGEFVGTTMATGLSGGGKSGIFRWDNTGGASSVVTGSYPAQDTMIMDPISWFTAVPETATVDARLSQDYFVSGLFPQPRPADVAGSAVMLHGTSTAPGGTAQITLFAADPLYRGDPEREWPAFSGAVYWSAD